MLIVLDKKDRENQGDLIFPAQFVTAQKVNFMLKHGRGMVCVPITWKQALQFELPLMVVSSQNTEVTGVNFTISVDSKKVSSFGISASDRAQTIATLADSKSKPNDLVRPGHVFPLLSSDGGILEREGHTEATVELLQLSKLKPVGVLCEILREDGEVAAPSDLVKFSKAFKIKIVSIADLVEFVKKRSKRKLRQTVSSVKRLATSLLPTRSGIFRIIIYRSIYDNCEHVVLKSDKRERQFPLVRLHSKCQTGDTFSSLRCDCGEQLQQSMRLIGEKGGIVLYLNQEGRGIGLVNKIIAYSLQDKGVDTVDANLNLGLPIDARDYRVAADILKDLGILRINLLTNNPRKERELERLGIAVEHRIPIEVAPNKVNHGYLLAKKEKLGHKLTKV